MSINLAAKLVVVGMLFGLKAFAQDTGPHRDNEVTSLNTCTVALDKTTLTLVTTSPTGINSQKFNYTCRCTGNGTCRWSYNGQPATYTGGRTICNGGKCCPWFNNEHWANTDVSAFPTSYGSPFWRDALTPSQVIISTCTWLAGVSTCVSPSLTTVTTGNFYFIKGISPSGYNPYQSSWTIPDDSYVQVTKIDATHFSYPLAINPGGSGTGGTLYSTVLRGKFIPSMVLNSADNTTPTPATSADAANFSDPGPFPITTGMFVEGYVFGGSQTVAGGPYAPAQDAHLQVINFDTCTLFEGYHLFSTSAPFHFASVANWDLYSTYGRLNGRYMWYGFDTNGVDGSSAGGLPQTPLVLTYAEIFDNLPAPGQPDLYPIPHAARITLPVAYINKGGVLFPATHGAGNTNDSSLVPYGARGVLDPSFNRTTCPLYDYAGQAYSSYPAMIRILNMIATYGVVVDDIGGNGGISFTTDTDQRWGDPNLSTSANWIINGWGHCLDGTAFLWKHITPDPAAGLFSTNIR